MKLLRACLLGLFAASTQAAGLWHGPYQDGSMAEPAVPLPPPKPGHVVVWAFATGACGDEKWGAFDTDTFAREKRQAFEREGRDFIVSTGGEADSFHCETDEGMARFMARYNSPRLVGVDFDIERNQTPAQIDALVQRARWLHQQQPKLRLLFTLASHAASDGSGRSLNATGLTVLAALRRHGLQDIAVINLMVMNYGPADARWCVVSQARCDMGASALQAARNLHTQHGIAYSRIALTAMPGENDVAGNVFLHADAHTLMQGARDLGLAGVHYWSRGRDQSCPAGSPRVSPLCHGLPGLPVGAFGKALGG
jgi:hypothetical protein